MIVAAAKDVFVLGVPVWRRFVTAPGRLFSFAALAPMVVRESALCSISDMLCLARR
jgi:hypothetical protein